MPETSAKILAKFGLNAADMPVLKGFNAAKEIEALQPGHKFEVGDALFERIAPEKNEELKAKYGSDKK